MFIRSTGLLKYLQLVFPCLLNMNERVKNIKMKYRILLDFSIALYKYACEIKFMYGSENSMVPNFYEVLETLQRIIRGQNYDQRDTEMFQDLHNLTYAAFHNGTGQSELAKLNLREFFEEYGYEAESANLPYKRSIIIGLYFYQMSVATKNDDNQKTTIDYLVSAHKHIRRIVDQRVLEYPFYCYLVLGELVLSVYPIRFLF